MTVYRAEILQRTDAAFHFAYAIIAAVVLAIADPDWIGAIVALMFGPIFYYIMVRSTAAKSCEPVPPASGTRLATERQTQRRAVLFNLPVGLFHAALLATTFAIDEPLWILPGILGGAGAAQMRSARKSRDDAARVPGTLRVTASARSGQRGPLLWRTEWGDVAP